MADKHLMLVSTVEKYPCLYNNNLIDYMKKDVTEKAWNEVANQVSLPVAECKEKWRNLRYSLLRSLKPNADGTSKKKYYLHKDMEFLIPFIKTKGVFSTHFEEEVEEDMTSEIDDVTSPQQQLFEYEFIEPVNKKKKHNNMPNIEHFQNDYVSEQDTRKMFLLGLLPEVNALSDGQMKLFRRKVLTLLDDIADTNVDEDDALNRPIKNEPTSREGRSSTFM